MKKSNFKIILLAGGEASRYGKSIQGKINAQNDKLLSFHENKSLIEHVTNELRTLGDLLIVTRGNERKSNYSALLKTENHHYSIKVIKENHEKAIGPLGGIYTALEYYKDIKTKLILPADLPNIRREVIAELMQVVSESGTFDLFAFVHPNGQTENLLMVIDDKNSFSLINSLIKANIHRVSSFFRLISNKRFINSSYLRSIKNNANTIYPFSDFDDINPIRTINPFNKEKESHNIIKGPFIDFGLNNGVSHDPSLLFHKYLDWKRNYSTKKHKINPVIGILKEESEIYRKNGLLSLSLHCLLDAYKINPDPQISNQIGDLIAKLEF